MGRPLTRTEALAAVRRGQQVAQVLGYQREAGSGPGTLTFAYIAPSPREGIRARVMTVEDVGDGQSADMSWFPEVDEWEPEFDAAGSLLNGPDPAERTFPSAEEAFDAMSTESSAADESWHHESMIGDEYLAARKAALQMEA